MMCECTVCVLRRGELRKLSWMIEFGGASEESKQTREAATTLQSAFSHANPSAQSKAKKLEWSSSQVKWKVFVCNLLFAVSSFYAVCRPYVRERAPANLVSSCPVMCVLLFPIFGSVTCCSHTTDGRNLGAQQATRRTSKSKSKVAKPPPTTEQAIQPPRTPDEKRNRKREAILGSLW